MINVANHSDLVKDVDTNAVLNNNVSLLQEHKNKKLFFNTLSTRICSLEQQMENMQRILNDLVGKNNG